MKATSTLVLKKLGKKINKGLQKKFLTDPQIKKPPPVAPTIYGTNLTLQVKCFWSAKSYEAWTLCQRLPTIFGYVFGI